MATGSTSKAARSTTTTSTASTDYRDNVRMNVLNRTDVQIQGRQRETGLGAALGEHEHDLHRRVRQPRSATASATATSCRSTSCASSGDGRDKTYIPRAALRYAIQRHVLDAHSACSRAARTSRAIAGAAASCRRTGRDHLLRERRRHLVDLRDRACGACSRIWSCRWACALRRGRSHAGQPDRLSMLPGVVLPDPHRDDRFLEVEPRVSPDQVPARWT